MLLHCLVFISLLVFIILHLIFNNKIDIRINSPPLDQSHAKSGASRPYGGIIRGRAIGNAPNIGDLQRLSPEHVDIQGLVDLVLSNDRPNVLEVDPSSVVAVSIPYTEQLGPVLERVARSYSPIRSIYSIIIII